MPFWSYAKLIFTCWLVIPYFSGAAYVYDHYVRPYLVTRQKSVNIWYVPRKKDVFSKPDDILTAAEKYIEENGPDAFEKIIHRVCGFDPFTLDLSLKSLHHICSPPMVYISYVVLFLPSPEKPLQGLATTHSITTATAMRMTTDTDMVRSLVFLSCITWL